MTQNLNSSQRTIKNVVCFTNNPWNGAVVELRVKAPLQMCGFDITQGNDANILIIDDLSKADVVLVQRDFPRHVDLFFDILNQTRKYNIPLIYEIDDLVFDLPEDHPDRQINHYTSALTPMLLAASKADVVTTSTEQLASFFKLFNPNTRVLQNYLVDSYWTLKEPKKPEAASEPIVIGYAGTGTHRADLQMVLPSLIEVAEKYGPRVTFKFWGITPPAELSSRFPVQSYPEIDSYIDFAQAMCKEQADILIAPLVSNKFGHSKSLIKFLEYSSLGVPAIYSKTVPYETVVVHEQNGFLASTPEDWVHYLENLIESPQLRFQIAIRAQEEVQSHWLLSQHDSEWAETYYDAFNLKSPITDAVKQRETVLQNAMHLQVTQVNEYQRQIVELKAYEEAFEELMSLKTSRSWRLYVLLTSFFRRAIPPGTLRDRIFTQVWKRLHLSYRMAKRVRAKLSALENRSSHISILPISIKPNFETHVETVDVIICVHNALTDVQRCLESVIKYTSQPYSLILVDDGSDKPTQSYLQQFAASHPNCTLLRNDKAGGYTRAANKGLRQSQGQCVVLLNSDTLVGPEWIDRLCLAMRSDPQNGIVGPLSNTASWQSIPKLTEDGDWASNTLPDRTTAAEMSTLIAKHSVHTYFQVPLLNGFCMMIRRDVLNDIGYFDEESFGEGYGEEDDFNLRAQKKGWKLAIADDTYVYHAQSKSYSSERRHQLSLRAGKILREKHGERTIQAAVEYMNPNRILEGIRAVSETVLERENYVKRGKEKYAGKRVLFVLPVMEAGGGANVVIDEARAMRSMGVDAQLFNEIDYKKGFLSSYPHLDIPINFGKPQAMADMDQAYDAIIATANYSVEWIKPLEEKLVLGYYVQGYEPLMYPKGSVTEKRAIASYSLIEGLKRFTKTQWVRQMVLTNTKMDSDVIGISVNTDLFRPRHARPLGKKPVTVSAMIRPEAPYRSPELTVSVLRRLQQEYLQDVNILLFGTDSLEEHGSLFQLDFEWKLAGKLTQLQVANLLSQSDIFVDFSTHQAMGLTALEAMACGCAVIVPQHGGAIEFVRDRENGLVVSTISQEACYQQLRNLIENDYLRQRAQIAGLKTVARFFPEKAGFNILKTLFS